MSSETTSSTPVALIIDDEPQIRRLLRVTLEANGYRVHILCTMRKLDGDVFSLKKPREWNDKGLLVKQRESWAVAVNAALEKAGLDARVNHRSLKDQGIDREPQPKIGVSATAMKRKGVLEDPERFEVVRRVKIMNEVRPMMKAIRGRGEVSQNGIGVTWWEKSITFMSRIRQQADKAVKTAWRKLVDAKRRKAGKDGPQITM